jgi:hypothetical protein
MAPGRVDGIGRSEVIRPFYNCIASKHACSGVHFGW